MWRLATGLAASLTALGLVAGFPAAASAAAPPPPAPGIAPGAVAEGVGVVDLFYTAANGTVWLPGSRRISNCAPPRPSSSA